MCSDDTGRLTYNGARSGRIFYILRIWHEQSGSAKTYILQIVAVSSAPFAQTQMLNAGSLRTLKNQSSSVVGWNRGQIL